MKTFHIHLPEIWEHKRQGGEIIIFMTQDALPMGDSWISKIVKPLDECKVAAVSVAELCPETTELFL